MVICGEVELRIHHHLLVGESTKTNNITRIYSHAQSLAQCRKWLDAHYRMWAGGGIEQCRGRQARERRVELGGDRR